MSRIVVALGGNALGNTPDEQKHNIQGAVSSLVQLIKDGHEIILTHGNGPQVGMIQLAFEKSSKVDGKIPMMDLPECTAMSQGYIGFHLQNELIGELKNQGLPANVVTVITQVIVKKEDPSFKNPTKPIGVYYDEETAKVLMRTHPDEVYANDAGRGYRKMVASPKPVGIVEISIIDQLIKQGNIVIACGGGGIPVIQEGTKYKSVPAVIDKDLASAKLAEMVDADYLLILTDVDRVAINWGKSNQKNLSKLTIKEAVTYCEDGHFAPGSMLPKVQAAVQFVKSGKRRKAIITSLENSLAALNGKAGTLIVEEMNEF